jgi:hypothetical protein
VAALRQHRKRQVEARRVSGSGSSALPALDKSAAEVVASLILGTDVSKR